MNVQLNKADMFLAGCIGTCLLAYIAGHFIDRPFPEAMEAVKYFGLGLGLNQIAK